MRAMSRKLLCVFISLARIMAHYAVWQVLHAYFPHDGGIPIRRCIWKHVNADVRAARRNQPQTPSTWQRRRMEFARPMYAPTSSNFISVGAPSGYGKTTCCVMLCADILRRTPSGTVVAIIGMGRRATTRMISVLADMMSDWAALKVVHNQERLEWADGATRWRVTCSPDNAETRSMSANIILWDDFFDLSGLNLVHSKQVLMDAILASFRRRYRPIPLECLVIAFGTSKQCHLSAHRRCNYIDRHPLLLDTT